MESLGERVLHITLGEGRIVARDGRYLSVEFPSGVRRFVYPSAFRGYLTALSEPWAREIQRDLAALDAEEAKRAARQREEQKHLSGGIVIPGRRIDPDTENTP